MDQSPIIIQDDRGGNLGDYINRVAEARSSGREVQADGNCWSGCTLYTTLGDQFCVGPKAVLGFHDGSTPMGYNEVVVRSMRGVLMAYYPPQLKVYLLKRGGLSEKPIFILGEALHKMFRSCG